MTPREALATLHDISRIHAMIFEGTDNCPLCVAVAIVEEELGRLEAGLDAAQGDAANWKRHSTDNHAEAERLEKALLAIIACDYRGSMPREHVIARNAIRRWRPQT